MRKSLVVVLICSAGTAALQSAEARSLLTNGNLDRVHGVEIVPMFFLPKPDAWVNEGFRTLTGPYEDEMSSEPWAGPAPTPVTADGFFNAVPYNDSPDRAVFFKGFSGNTTTDGPATGHLYQDVPGMGGVQYELTGWAGAEPNYLGGAEFALDFLNSRGGLIGSAILDLIAAGLFVDNGQPFDYKQYSVSAIAPEGTVVVRARASMISAMGNPAGGGQAYVVDDFVLVPAPSTGALGLLLGLAAVRRKR